MDNMEEEDEMSLLDYRSPKGKLIKLIDQKMKKFQIDETLGNVLDQFSQLTQEQTAFLENGIFHMNFAEDALLLQSCGQYYGKMVDKLWDDLLQLHTRLVKYDETTAKNCSDQDKKDERKKEIERLEERLNRGKRKKVVLTEPENEAAPVNGCFIFDVDQNCFSELFNGITYPLPEEIEGQGADEEPVAPFETHTELLDEWKAIRQIDGTEKKRNGNSVLVAQYHRLRYRCKHYSTPTSDAMIYDWSDPDEFNTREGRLISFHHIKHLFEYNDKCLLPDEDFTVARLRIAYILKKKWLMRNKVSPDAAYDTYKDAWEQYEKDFFQNEQRKIQNMPQSNSEQLLKFYKALAKKEQIAIQKVEKLRAMGVKNLPVISFENVIVAPCKEGYEGIFDPYIPDEFDTPLPVVDISEGAHLLEGDYEAELSKILDSRKLPDSSTEEQNKERSDSGYFDAGFEGDDYSENGDRFESAVTTGSDTPFEFDKNLENKGETPTVDIDRSIEKENSQTPTTVEDTNNNNQIENETEEVLNHLESNQPRFDPRYSPVDDHLVRSASASEQIIMKSGNISTEMSRPEMNLALKEFVRQACPDEPELIYLAVENSYFNQTEDLITIIYDKPGEEDSDDEDDGDQIVVFGHFDKKANKKQAAKKQEKIVESTIERCVQKEESKKRKLDVHEEPLPKRRKLSQKQVEKLKKSLIPPVKENKWELFFCLNYQSEAGEGDVIRIEYESDVEDEDLFEDTGADNEEDTIESPETEVEPENRSETPLPLSQDSGIDLDISISDIEAATQIENETSENCTSDLSKIDFLDNVSKTTDISREELEKEHTSQDVPYQTPYEQEREKARQRVVEWKEYIVPKLKKLAEHDFDIHKYGANIMDSMEVNEQKPFGQLVAGKSSAEVVRFFISSLQLANTMNVEICGSKKGELSNDTFSLKLLSKERYHEHFREYQAPSEEGLQDKLKKVKEIRMQNRALSNKLTTKRKLPNESQGILKSYNSCGKKAGTSPRGQPMKKIKILSYNMIRSPSRGDQGLSSISTDQQNVDFQQPSTSWQADWVEQNAFDSVASSDIPQTPNRISIDSGCIPSCDEDFLEQFDQLQQISPNYAQTTSTPIKPRKILKINMVRSNFTN